MQLGRMNGLPGPLIVVCLLVLLAAVLPDIRMHYYLQGGE